MIRIVERKLACAPSSIANAAGTALNSLLTVFTEKSVRVIHQNAHSNAAHLVLVLELHVDLYVVPSQADVIRCFCVVSKGELETKSLGIERYTAQDLPRPNNRMSLFEHGFECRMKGFSGHYCRIKLAVLAVGYGEQKGRSQ